MRRLLWVLLTTGLLALLGCAGDDGADGLDGAPGQDAVDTGTISGRVVDESGNPVAGATVETAPPMQLAITDADGRFTMISIPVGAYETVARNGDSVCRLLVGVVGGGVTNVTMTLLPPAGSATATISGTVVDVNGEPVVGATVNVAGQGGTAVTGAEGSFTIAEVVPGLVRLNVTAPSDAYLDGETRKALRAVSGETLSDVQITLSGRPGAAATYLGISMCRVCHGTTWPDIFAAYDGTPDAAIHSRFVTEGTSHLVYKNLWPLPGEKLLPRDPKGALLKVQDPLDGNGRVHVVLCTQGEEPDRQYLFKFYPEAAGDLTEEQLDCSESPSTAVWIPVAATIGGEGNWGEGYVDPEHQLPDRHPNFGEGKQRYMCRIQDVPFLVQWMAQNGVDRTGQKQDYVCYMPVFVMQDGTAVDSDVLAAGEVGFPNFWQKSPGHWCTPDNTLSRNCAGCHATGLKIETKDFLDDPNPEHQYKAVVTNWDYKDLNVTCERCHGPGSEHLFQGGDKTKLIMPQYLTTKAANETCGQCHGNHDGRSLTPYGIYKPAYDGNYKDTLGHGSFVPGVYALETFFANFDQATTTITPDWKVGSFFSWPDQTHARTHSQMYLELRRSVHYNNPFQSLACFDCHNAHTLDGGPSSLARDGYDFVDAAYGNNTLCLACHAGHGPFTSVGTADVAVLQLDAGRQVAKDGAAVVVSGPDAALARNRVAKAVAEHMQTRAAMGGALYRPEDPEMPTGSCTSCHMAKISKQQDINVDAMWHLAPDKSGKSAVAEGNVPSHVFDIVWPAQSVILKNPDPSKGKDYDIMPNSCSKCHAFARISGDND